VIHDIALVVAPLVVNLDEVILDDVMLDDVISLVVVCDSMVVT